MPNLIYADNAATTKLDIDAFEAMRPFLLDSYGNPSQPYSFSRDCKKAIRQARETIASCIGASSEEIFFTSGGTESDNWAIKGGCGIAGKIMTSCVEHHAILNACKSLENHGRQVLYVPVSDEGIVDLDYIRHNIADNIALLSVMYANNEVGSIQPIKMLAEIAHEYNVPFHTDAVQAVGHITIDVRNSDIDMLSASAHKFNGPKGVGFLFVRKGVEINPYLDGGSQERGLRGGTENVAAIVAMAVALKKNYEEIIKNAQHLDYLESILIKQLDVSHVDYRRNGAKSHVPGNISLSFSEAEGEMLLHRLDLKGICVSTGSACDSVNTQVSHVIKAIGVPDKYARGTIRISLGKHNTKQDVDTIAGEIIKIISTKDL